MLVTLFAPMRADRHGPPIDYLSEKLVFLGSLDTREPVDFDRDRKSGLEPFG